MTYKVEALPNSQLGLGEGPHWDIETQSLYLVDLKSGKIARFDYNENKMYTSKIENERYATFIIPIEGQKCKFVVGCGKRGVIVTWDGVAPTCKIDKCLFEVEQNDPKFDGNRLNDAKCDPQGRLFFGSMRDGDIFEFRYGSLYKYVGNGSTEVLKDDVGVSNGLGWDAAKKKFYYVDTCDFELKSYDYNAKCGKICTPKVVYDFRGKGPNGANLLPDGLTLDTEGKVYVATFNGSAIYKINPNNCEMEQEIKIPCEKITSVAFGGPNLDILYVTSAVEGDKNPVAGTTYKVTGLCASGLPMTKFCNA